MGTLPKGDLSRLGPLYARLEYRVYAIQDHLRGDSQQESGSCVRLARSATVQRELYSDNKRVILRTFGGIGQSL